MTLYCPSCGRLLLQDARFCSLCGNAVPPEAFNPIPPPGVVKPVAFEESNPPPIEPSFSSPLHIASQPSYSQVETQEQDVPQLVYPPPKSANRRQSYIRAWLWGGITLVLLVSVVSLMLFLLLSSSRSTMLIGKWTRITNFPTTTPTVFVSVDSTETVTSLFGNPYANYCSNSSDMMEFFNDGTIEIRTDQKYPDSAASFRSVYIGEYEVIDSDHFRYEALWGHTILDFSLSGDVLTIRHKRPCGDVQWRRMSTGGVEGNMDSPMNVVELFYRVALDEHSSDYGHNDLAFSLLAPESRISNVTDLARISEEWKNEHGTLVALQITDIEGTEARDEPDATARLLVQATYSDGLISSAFVQLQRQGNRFLITDVGP